MKLLWISACILPLYILASIAVNIDEWYGLEPSRLAKKLAKIPTDHLKDHIGSLLAAGMEPDQIDQVLVRSPASGMATGISEGSKFELDQSLFVVHASVKAIWHLEACRSGRVVKKLFDEHQAVGESDPLYIVVYDE